MRISIGWENSNDTLKFASAGTDVLLEVGGGPGAASLSVSDRGPGIAPDQRHLVQRRFYRVEQSRTVEGGGLGLSIVAAIVHLHGFCLAIDDAAPSFLVKIQC